MLQQGEQSYLSQYIYTMTTFCVTEDKQNNANEGWSWRHSHHLQNSIIIITRIQKCHPSDAKTQRVI